MHFCDVRTTYSTPLGLFYTLVFDRVTVHGHLLVECEIGVRPLKRLGLLAWRAEAHGHRMLTLICLEYHRDQIPRYGKILH